MNKEEIRADFKRMYDELTNPEIREENKRKAEREQRIEDRKADTGAYVI